MELAGQVELCEEEEKNTFMRKRRRESDIQRDRGEEEERQSF